MTSTSTIKNRQYGKLTATEKARLFFWLNVLPLHVAYHLLTTSSPKPWRRIVCERIARFTTSKLPVLAPQYLLKSSMHTYKKWTRSRRMPRTIDILPDGAHLSWIGSKSLDKVILFIPGGGFVSPMLDFAHDFLHYIQTQIVVTHGVQIGVCALAYNLIPTACFPSQLRDAHAAVDFLFQSGVQPSNLQLIGESAGGTIIIQLLRHIHHPHPAVEPLPDNTRFAAVCIMSPGVPYFDHDPSVRVDKDLITLKALNRFSNLLTCDVLESDMFYLEPSEGFLSTLDARMMVTGGTEELMAAGHTRLKAELERCQDVDLHWVVDEGGLHCGPVFDFPLNFLGGKPYVGETTRKIVEWVADGFDTLFEV